MTYKRVAYRTTDNRNLRFAVVPSMFISDLLDWLTLSETAEIVSICDDYTRTLSGQPEFVAPPEWPSYRTCAQYIHTVSLVQGR